MGLEEIKNKSVPLANKYGLKNMSIFGSYASGEHSENSDIDFLVEFFDVPSILKVMGLREELRRALKKEVDVVTLPLARPGKLSIGKSVRIYG